MSLVPEPVTIGRVKAPPPGLYPGIDFDTYASWEAVNQTILKGFSRTPAHVLYSLQTGGETTPALELGWITHLATFEPDSYEQKVKAAPVLDKRTKKGKKIWADLEADHPDRLIVRFEDDAKARAMAKAIRSHPTARVFLEGRGENEISVVWYEENNGYKIKCKSRLDRYGFLNEWPVIGDLKSTRNAGRRQFERSILDFGYDVQAAHYLAGLESLFPIESGDPYRRFLFLAVESSPPHVPAVYELDDEALEEGNRKRLVYLNKWRECVDSNKWPGYPDGVQIASLPPWALKVFTEEV